MNENTTPQSAYDDEQASYGREALDLSSFAADISLEEAVSKYTIGSIHGGPWFQIGIDTLSPVKTVGKGRTNITLIRPTILQTDTNSPNVPYAGFDMTKSPDRQPAVSVHVDPTAYGISTTGNYLVQFLVECARPCTFSVGGYAVGGTVGGAGSRTVTGRSTITVALQNLPAVPGASASITQTGGADWAWYSTGFSYPPLVFTIGS